MFHKPKIRCGGWDARSLAVDEASGGALDNGVVLAAEIKERRGPDLS